jgi:SAM-dependent methyltransferase
MTPNFDQAYMAHRKHIAWRGPVIAHAILAVLGPKTILDLGCGTGDIVAGFLDLGAEAWGVDNSLAAMELLPPERRVPGNLRLPPTTWHWPSTAMALEKPVDLLILLEVLSILENDALTGTTAAAQASQILYRAMDLGQALLVNHLKPMDEDLLRDNGWDLDHTLTARLRANLSPWGSKQAIKALYLTGEIWQKRTPEPGDQPRQAGTTGDPLFRLALESTRENLGMKNSDRKPPICGNDYEG